MPLDELDIQKLGLNAQNIEFLRELETRTGGSFTVLDLDELQKIILTVGDTKPAITQLKAELNAIASQVNSYFIPSIERLQNQVNDLEKRLTRQSINNFDERITNLEKVTM